ncbi:MAG: hypothetical protein IKG93_02465 [Clostridiales bacterium]|nr:hypothetical protein [Clostridiales bacterium]
MEIAFHCPNCLADLIFDESKKYTCCFCHTTLTGKDEVRELEGGYYVGDAWNEDLYHQYKCEDCNGEFIMKTANAKQGCPLCSAAALKDQGPVIGAMPKRAIPFAHTKQQAEEMFLDYLRNNSAVGRTLATEENKALLHKAYVPCWIFTYEVVAHAKLTVTIRNRANESKTFLGINGTEAIAEQLSALRSSFSRFQGRKGKNAKDAANQPSEHVTGGVLSWQGIPFDATGILPESVISGLQPYDQSKLVNLSEKILGDTPVLAIKKDPIACMQEFMDRVKKWTRQMIMDAHSDSYDISYFQDKTDYPLGIGELVLFPIWYMKGDYSGREYFFSMNGQTGEVEANIPMSKVSSKNTGLTYQSFWDKSRCTALTDTHFEFNIHDPNIEILDYSFFEKPRDSKLTADGRKKSSSISHAITEPELETPEAEDVEKAEAEAAPEEKPAPSKTKKPAVPLDVQVVTDLKSLQLSKADEAKRDKERAARLRAAAREGAKAPMEAASEAPSWAKAVTPPPAASSTPNKRSVRTKKPAMEKPSVASSGNKPLWERSEDILEDSRFSNSKPASLAEWVSRNPKPEGESRMNQPIWNRDPDDMLSDDEHVPELGQDMINSLPLGSLGNYQRRGDRNRRDDDRDLGEPAREVQVKSYGLDDRHESGLVESVDDVLEQARREAEEYEASLRAAREEAIERYEEEYGQEEQFPAEDFGEDIPQQIEEMSAGAVEEAISEVIPEDVSEVVPEVIPEEIPEEISAPADELSKDEENDLPEFEEYTEGNEDMVANITFSFNKKKQAAEREHKTMSGTSIPRMPEQRPARERGMAIMNSEYDSGVLPGVARQRDTDVVEYSPETLEEKKNDVSENYFGSDANDRPLKYRPAAPLAQVRNDVYVEEVEHHPEEDENNRPLASRPAAPLARVTEVAPSAEYIAEHGIDDDVHQIPSLARGGGRWGEMPEATETPSWAKPQGGETRESRLGSPRDRVRRPSRDELMGRGRRDEEPEEQEETLNRSSAFRRPDQSDRTPTTRPAARPTASRPVPSRPTASRPGARPTASRPEGGRPMSERPGARSATAGAVEKPEKQVPIWERVPDTDRPLSPWGTPMGFNDDQRPAGSLTKPKGQIIDVEKPRTRPGLGGLGRYDEGQPKEVLPSHEERLSSSEAREIPMPKFGRSEESREVEVKMPPRGRRDIPVERPQPPRARREIEVEMPAPRARREVGVEIPQPEFDRRDDGDRFGRREPSGFAEQRPRTFAQRRQVVEEETEVENVRNFASDDDIPSLARGGINPIREGLRAEEENVKKAMRDLPIFDPDGPSPFKKN